jgi:transposase
MEKQRRSFSEEFKREAVRRVENHESTFSQIARELGINRSLLQLWRKRYGTQTSKGSPAKPSESLEEENRRLRRENASLREDREILKKAAAFFAKEPR